MQVKNHEQILPDTMTGENSNNVIRQHFKHQNLDEGVLETRDGSTRI